MPTTQIRMAPCLGWMEDTGVTVLGTLALSTTTTWLGFSFMVSETKTLSKVEIYTTAASGLGATDLECHVFDSSASSPGTSLSSTNTVTTTPTGAQWTEFTGLSQVLTAGKIYWLVFKQVNAAASVTYQYGTGLIIPTISGTNSAAPWTKKHTTDGAAWVTSVSNVFGFRLEFSDGSFDGVPIQAVSSSAVGDGVYSSREVGAYFTMPGPATLQYNVRGIKMPIAKTGSPTGWPTFNIRAGASPGSPSTTNQITTAASGADFAVAGNWYGYFSSAVPMTGGTIYRVTLGESSQSDASGNRYNTYVFTIDNTAASKALMLFGSCQKTYYNGSVWAETDTNTVPFALILDTDSPFATSGTTVPAPIEVPTYAWR